MPGKTCNRWSIILGLLLAWPGGSSSAQNPHVVPEGPLTPQEQLEKFHVPPGFEIELVASEPQIHKPLNLSFDRRGRLWVTDTVEYPFPPKGPGRDSLKVLEDRDGDGHFETVTTLVDQLSMPTGAAPIPDGAIVFSVPSIFGCHDTDGDGKIDRRRVLYTEFGNVDTHGMNNGFTRWLDGWIYACHGFRNTSQVSGSGERQITMNSGNGYRFRPDGSQIEQVWHGQVNPYGLAFDSLGNLFTADCHTKPAYSPLRGACYPSFAKPHDGLGFGPKLIEHTHGSTSISGVAYYAADQFPKEYRNTVFMGNSVTGRVNHDRVVARGSSLRGIELPDFVRCDDRWFRPVELKLGPDGALYIADFYNCIIGHYEVPLTHPRRDRQRGRVWRVFWKGTSEQPGRRRKIHDLRGFELPRLWTCLGDANLSVRTLATHEIVDRFGAEASGPVRKWIVQPCDPRQRAHGLWVLARLDALDDELVRRLADDEDRLVRVHLVKAMAERADWDATEVPLGELVRKKLFDADPFVRRAAADALGRHPDAANVDPLLRLWAETPPEDTYLIHTVRMALRDHLKQPEICARQTQLGENADRTHRLLDVSLGVRNAPSARFVLAALSAGKADERRLGEMIHYTTRYTADEQTDALLEHMLSWQTADAGRQLAVFRPFLSAMQERGRALPPSFHPWAERLARQLMARDDGARKLEGVQLAAHLRLDVLYDSLAEIAASRRHGEPLRAAAVDACAAAGGSRGLKLLGAMLGNPSEVLALRSKAAGALAKINTDPGRKLLLERLQTAHHRLAVEVAAALAASRPGAEMLLAAVKQGKASPGLLREGLVQRNLQGAKVPDLAARLAKLTEGLPPPDEAVARLIQQRRTAFLAAKLNIKVPDPQQGQAAFKKHCGICHRIAGEGEKFGPELDGIGLRGLDRLLEDLLDPNRNVDPAFLSTVVITDDGLTQTGLALRDEGSVLILVDAEGKQLRLDHDAIDERFTSPLSPMPNAAEKTLSEADFLHLLKYLLNNTSEPKQSDSAE